ncbi:hypothetical protein J6590_016591 [Homalodisca vitripennis]|nr:hypothetical protein J6590_016591 [Homalodisca vitripennis]
MNVQVSEWKNLIAIEKRKRWFINLGIVGNRGIWVWVGSQVSPWVGHFPSSDHVELTERSREFSYCLGGVFLCRQKCGATREFRICIIPTI